MKLFITPSYTFTPGLSGVGTVNLSGIGAFNAKYLVSIINQTKGVIIYATGSTALRYTNLASTTLTLFLDTSSMSNTDVLQVIYDDQTATLAVSNSGLSNLDASLSTIATNAKQDALATLTGALTETAPTTDTASSGLNGRLQRIAQGLTSIIGKIPAALGVTTSAGSLSIAPASDAIFNVKPKALTNSYAEYLTLTTVQTFTAPANAIGGKIMASDVNTDNVNFKQNGTATTTSGMQLQAGRAEDFIGGNDITVVSKTGTQAVMIQWVIQA